MRSLQLVMLALLATAARADLFEQLPALKGLDEKAILAEIAAGGSVDIESADLNFDLSGDSTGWVLIDRVTIWTYLPFVAAAEPYSPTLEPILPGFPYFLNFSITDPATATLPPLAFFDAAGDPVSLDEIGITSASGFTYGGRATVPEPASLWLLLSGCTLAYAARKLASWGRGSVGAGRRIDMAGSEPQLAR